LKKNLDTLFIVKQILSDCIQLIELITENLLGNSLVDKTICMDARQAWGTLYNVHSLYGHSMAQSTYRFILYLSTTSGNGS